VRADALDERQLLSTIRSEPAVDGPWGGVEAFVCEVLKQFDHGR
jgi:hypothetical protein